MYDEPYEGESSEWEAAVERYWDAQRLILDMGLERLSDSD